MEINEKEETIESLREEVAQLHNNITGLLQRIGDESICKGCRAVIWRVQHKNGKKAPYTSAGLNHFADCTEAKNFRRK